MRPIISYGLEREMMLILDHVRRRYIFPHNDFSPRKNLYLSPSIIAEILNMQEQQTVLGKTARK